MTVFRENFWGEKNQGFACLYHNMKHGQTSTKELADFLRERAMVEETYSKSIIKLAKTASNSTNVGTFAPLWQVLKNATEKLAASHQKLVSKLQDVLKEVQKYGEDQHKKHKVVKGDVQTTADVVTNLQTTTELVARAKEAYHARCIECEKLKKEGITGKDLEKAEAKNKKAMEEYKALIDKYAKLREEFQKKMTDTCQKFQTIEEDHLRKLKEFIQSYSGAVHECQQSIDLVHTEFNEQCEELSELKLIELFAEAKGTGKEQPAVIEFEECDLSNIPTPEPEKLKKKKAKKAKKKKDKDGNSPGDSPDMNTPQVDEEGFSIKPSEEQGHQAFYSESDSDSDVEVDKTKKIHVEIKPPTVPVDGTKLTASVDDIKASLSGLALSPPRMRRDNSNGDISNRRHQAQLRASGKSSSFGNLLDLDFFPSTTSSSLMSPTSNASNTSAATTPDSTLSTLDLLTGLDGSFSSPYTGTGWSMSNDLLQSPTTTSNSLPPPLPEKQRNSMSSVSSTNSSIPILPNRPPSRARKDIPSPSFSDRELPPFPRQDSSSSLSSPFSSSIAMGGSRGPSPLTLGFSDTIPIAAAFTEQANAYFKGTDQSKSLAKITGDLMVSFPAGIIQALTSNPSPPVLSIRVNNINRLEQVLPNKQLITNDASMNQGDSHAYVFNMQNLITLIKKQAEKNAAASYFNVDILKYQVKPEADAGSMPLKLCSYWKCESTCTDIRVDYAYNASSMENPVPLSDVSLIVPVDGGVTVMQSKPAATWSAERKTALWKLGDITESTGNGSLRAKFELTEGPSRPATLAVKFQSEGTTLSGLDIELINPSYRLSLVKRRFATGKYLSES